MQMYFSTLPVTRDKTLVIKHKNEELVFIISALTQQVRKNVERDEHMNVLIAYIKERSIEDELFSLYKRIRETIDMDLVSKPSRKYFSLLVELADLFKREDVIPFIKYYDSKVSQIVTPVVKKEFDNNVTVNGQGTRAKTYTITDYEELLGLAIVAKAFYGPIISAITMNARAASKHQEPLVAYEWMLKTDISTWPAFNKIHDFASENILGPFKPRLATYAYTKLIGVDNIVDRVVGLYLFKLFAYTVLTNHDKNLAAAMFSMTRNEFGHVPVLIEKEAGASDTGKESVFEMHRISSSITQGDKALFHAYAEKPHLMLDNLSAIYGHSVSINEHNRLDELITQLEPLVNTQFNDGVIKLIEIGVHNIMHPDIIRYLTRSHIRNICAVLTLYTWLYGNKNIAMLFTTLMFTDKHNRLQSSYRAKLDLEVLTEVEHKYSVVRESKGKEVVNESIVHSAINDIVNSLTQGSYMYVSVGYGEEKIMSLSKDIKNDVLAYINDMVIN